MKADGTIDMDKLRTFYDPLGQDDPVISVMNNAPIPIEIEKVALEINGKELTLRQVFDHLTPLGLWVTAHSNGCITMLVGIPAKLLVERWLNRAKEDKGGIGAIYTKAGIVPIDSVDTRVIAEQFKKLGNKKILTQIFVTKFRLPALI